MHSPTVSASTQKIMVFFVNAVFFLLTGEFQGLNYSCELVSRHIVLCSPCRTPEAVICFFLEYRGQREVPK